MTSKAATRRVGGHHIAFATLVIVLLGWAGIGVEPAWLTIDAFQFFAKRTRTRPGSSACSLTTARSAPSPGVRMARGSPREDSSIER